MISFEYKLKVEIALQKGVVNGKIVSIGIKERNAVTLDIDNGNEIINVLKLYRFEHKVQFQSCMKSNAFGTINRVVDLRELLEGNDYCPRLTAQCFNRYPNQS